MTKLVFFFSKKENYDKMIMIKKIARLTVNINKPKKVENLIFHLRVHLWISPSLVLHTRQCPPVNWDWMVPRTNCCLFISPSLFIFVRVPHSLSLFIFVLLHIGIPKSVALSSINHFFFLGFTVDVVDDSFLFYF